MRHTIKLLALIAGLTIATFACDTCDKIDLLRLKRDVAFKEYSICIKHGEECEEEYELYRKAEIDLYKALERKSKLEDKIRKAKHNG